MQKLFALVDCNNFYVSCERLFQPRLQGRPVVVLSNNDGCVIARSNEAKALGVAMGAPYFKYKGLLARHDTAVFSSNYALYGDISRRVMAVLHQVEPEVEVYSIDEAFLRFTPPPGLEPEQYGREIRQLVMRATGIPVSIGIGPTRTLAKIANRVAKKKEEYGGVWTLSEEERDDALRRCPVTDVWGIGPRHGERLRRQAILTALDLKNADDEWLRRHLTVTGLRTAMELRGISCLAPEECPLTRRSIASSKSFGCPVESLADLREALATYVEQAAVKLRGRHALAGSLQVFLCTNRFRPTEPYYYGQQVATLTTATANSTVLIRHALAVLGHLYRPGLQYQKAGVVLFCLVGEEHRQPGLFTAPDRKSGPLMAALDTINERWGRHTIRHAVAAVNRPWANRQQMKSPAYTTRWSDLPVVRAI
ncbi:MAG: Y-family DNA polymerase [Thermodesulfobacteriota bacterium]